MPHQRSILEKAFKVPVRDHYGQAEGVANFLTKNLKNYLTENIFSKFW